MPAYLSAYPKLTNELKKKTGYNIATYRFSYTRNGEEFPLEEESVVENSTGSSVAISKLIDKNATWNPEYYGLNVTSTCVIQTPIFLFGKKGIIADDGELGVAIMWTSKDSNARGVQPIGFFRKSTIPQTIEGTLSFSPHIIRGTVSLKTIFYVQDPGHIPTTQSYLANKTGMILGELDETRIIVDGKGAVFPIVETDSKGEPLWWVECNWSDPTVDRFEEENFCIYLNTAHKDYPTLNENQGPKNSPLLADIIASALQILISKTLLDDTSGNTISGLGIEEGSISSVVRYFINTFGLNVHSNNPERLAVSIRKDLMNRFR